MFNCCPASAQGLAGRADSLLPSIHMLQWIRSTVKLLSPTRPAFSLLALGLLLVVLESSAMPAIAADHHAKPTVRPLILGANGLWMDGIGRWGGWNKLNWDWPAKIKSTGISVLRQQSAWTSVLQAAHSSGSSGRCNPACPGCEPDDGQTWCRPQNPREFSDPAYQWKGQDYVLRQASAAGIAVYLNYYHAPEWAERDLPRLRSIWGNQETYKARDVVSYTRPRPMTWIALTNSQGLTPNSNPAAWAPFSRQLGPAGGPAGAYALQRGSWRPDPQAYADFLYAAATRYNGHTPDPCATATTAQAIDWSCPLFTPPGAMLPRVKAFEIWNESNYSQFQAPHCNTAGTWNNGSPVYVEDPICPAGDGGVVEDFRDLLRLGYQAIKQAQPGATVVAGGLAASSGSAGNEIRPQRFLRQLFCLDHQVDGVCPKVWFDVLAIHAYTFSGIPTSKDEEDSSFLGRLPEVRTLLDQASSLGSINPAGRKQLWVNEWGWQTNDSGWRNNPDGLEQGNASGGNPMLNQTAAVYTAESLYRMWRAGVDQATWYALNDVGGGSLVARGGMWWGSGLLSDHSRQVACADSSCSEWTNQNCQKNWRTSTQTQSYAYCLDLTPKPSLNRAHRFPHYAWHNNRKVLLWTSLPQACRNHRSRISWYYQPAWGRRWRSFGVWHYAPSSEQLASGIIRLGWQMPRGLLKAVNKNPREVRILLRASVGCHDFSIPMPLTENPARSSSAFYIPQWSHHITTAKAYPCYKDSVWQQGASYHQWQLVVWQRKAWVSLVDTNQRHQPDTDSSYWHVYSSPGVLLSDPYEWGKMCSYRKGERVHYQDQTWVSMRAKNQGHAPTAESLRWQLLPS